jgi:hypothetical protein
MASKRFSFNKNDAVKFGNDALKVLGPYLIVIIPVLISNLPKEAVWTVVAVFILQRIRVALGLFLSGK